ncbi:hypothetical protein [Geoalkalibacter halelectricus]|uniref:Uncharacterized protein n=1 Tax=Geoalkalibacter halelectricus TaxID=2847045 RepID=A0ABY5ZKA4_9BACT|nr:hypothetical protein [Geoalkalibacter halelectricus]MDO3380192.1 hypothetical protein [Geoalkalibacter halelectricus]UWZ78235.1 hypothetical protein L9S41_11050 [Geoalkalibacter halelectricus]
MHIFTDGFTSVSLSNGNLRIKLAQNGPDNEPIEVATLIVPGVAASNFVNGLGHALKQLEEQIKAKQGEAAGEAKGN